MANMRYAFGIHSLPVSTRRVKLHGSVDPRRVHLSGRLLPPGHRRVRQHLSALPRRRAEPWLPFGRAVEGGHWLRNRRVFGNGCGSKPMVPFWGRGTTHFSLF